MPMTIRKTEITQTTLPWPRNWVFPAKQSDPPITLAARAISPAPPGKHDPAMCEEYERQWRATFPTLVDALRDVFPTCFLWAEGPLDRGELLDVFPYICARYGGRYHIAAATYLDLIGYQDGWVAFEFDREALTEMTKTVASLEASVRLYALWFDEDEVDLELIVTCCFGSHRHRQMVRKGQALALSCVRHFEAGYLVGTPDVIQRAEAVLRAQLGIKGE